MTTKIILFELSQEFMLVLEVREAAFYKAI